LSYGGRRDDHDFEYGFRPGQHPEITADLGMEPLGLGCGVCLMFSPGATALDAHGTQAVQCLWMIIPEGRKVRVASFVFTMQPASTRAFAKIEFPSSLDSPTLGRQIVGTIPRQLEAFFRRVREEVARSHGRASSR